MTEKGETNPEEETGDVERDIRSWAEKYAREHDLILNPEDKRLAIVIKGLARNLRKYGARYCPCRLRSGDAETDRKIICPCIYHDKEIETEGSCHCNLFFRKE